MRRIFLFLALGLLVASCSAIDEYKDERGRGDAGVGRRDELKKDVIFFPDHFANVAHGCDGHGHRVYVTTGEFKHPTVITDPSCADNNIESTLGEP